MDGIREIQSRISSSGDSYDQVLTKARSSGDYGLRIQRKDKMLRGQKIFRGRIRCSHGTDKVKFSQGTDGTKSRGRQRMKGIIATDVRKG